MNEGEKTNHWNSLAEELGAEPIDEPQSAETELSQGDDAGSEVTEEPAPPPRRRRSVESKRPEMKRPNHWGEVAGELGLEVPPEPEPVLPPEPAAAEALPAAPAEDIFADDGGPPELAVAPEQGRQDEAADEQRTIPLAIYDELEVPAADFLDDAAEAVDDEPEAATLDAPTESVEVADAPDAEGSEESEERPKRRRRRRRRSSRRSSAEETSEPAAAADEEEDEPPQEAGSGRRKRESRDARTKHRSIPTWEEAINVIVTTNIEARSKSSGGSSRRGRGRGRRGSSRDS